MQFTTQIPISKSNFPIDYNSEIMSLGSCFAVNIAEKLDHYKFRNLVNPFGILFHPLAIEKFIAAAVSKKEFIAKDIFFHDEVWHSFDAHSDLSAVNKDVLLDRLNNSSAKAGQSFSTATHLIITLGTAWVYRHSESGDIVANCHKVPQRQFTKELLSVETIKNSLVNIVNLIKSANKDCHIIFTISPVRHIKDGFVENQQSKANLIIALHDALNTECRTPNTTYFPSYEIMMDELRDYRFYAADMLHPNQIAMDYIWERFSQSVISEQALPVMESVVSVQKALAHKPFNPDSAQHREFLKKLQENIQKLQTQYPHILF